MKTGQVKPKEGRPRPEPKPDGKKSSWQSALGYVGVALVTWLDPRMYLRSSGTNDRGINQTGLLNVLVSGSANAESS